MYCSSADAGLSLKIRLVRLLIESSRSFVKMFVNMRGIQKLQRPKMRLNLGQYLVPESQTSLAGILTSLCIKKVFAECKIQ